MSVPSQYVCGQVRENGCTPNGLEVALHYYTRAEPHPRILAPAVAEATHELVKLGILRFEESSHSGCVFTEKGEAWMKMVLSTPMPVSITIYSDPREYSRQGID